MCCNLTDDKRHRLASNQTKVKYLPTCGSNTCCSEPSATRGDGTCLQLFSFGSLLRWSSSRQEGGDQKQDPGDWEDGPCLLGSQVGLFFPLISLPTEINQPLHPKSCLGSCEKVEGFTFFAALSPHSRKKSVRYFKSSQVFLEQGCRTERDALDGFPTFPGLAPLQFKANGFFLLSHVSSFNPAEVCQSILSLFNNEQACRENVFELFSVCRKVTASVSSEVVKPLD